MIDLFTQPPGPSYAPKELPKLCNTRTAIKDHYPEAWRIDEVQTAPKWKSEKTIKLNGRYYTIWFFYPFEAYGSRQLIVYYK